MHKEGSFTTPAGNYFTPLDVFTLLLFYFNITKKVLIILFWILFKILTYNKHFRNFHTNILVIILGYFFLILITCSYVRKKSANHYESINSHHIFLICF